MPRLFSRFLENPRQIGSVAASSRWLCEAMVRQARLDGRVLELGAGTGPITSRLLEAHPEPRLVEAVERDTELAEHLRRMFPSLLVHDKDLEIVLNETPHAYGSILSGIPFAVMNREKRDRVFRLIHDRLESGGRFVMFQYSRTTENELRELFGDARVTAIFVPLNLPPAFVFVCVKA